MHAIAVERDQIARHRFAVNKQMGVGNLHMVFSFANRNAVGSHRHSFTFARARRHAPGGVGGCGGARLAALTVGEQGGGQGYVALQRQVVGGLRGGSKVSR